LIEPAAKAFNLRPATVGDQPAITAIVREAGINPGHLEWPKFVVAERDGQVIGVGQVKPHSDGSRELASIAVRPEFQSQGVGSAICRALVERENGVLYLTTHVQLEMYYARFGFVRIGRDEMPPYFRRLSRVFAAIRPAVKLVFGVDLIVMKRLPL
jgi:N-acetylglutamate synthase-like GNAT family acetyltransferase